MIKITNFQILLLMGIVVLLIFIISPIIEKLNLDNKHREGHEMYLSDRFEIMAHGMVTNSGIEYQMTVFRDKSNLTEYIFYSEGGVGGVSKLQ